MNVQPVELAAFKTKLGWFGVSHRSGQIVKIKFGFADRRSVLEGFVDAKCTSSLSGKGFDLESDSPQTWQSDFVDYANGEVVSFSKVKLETQGLTEFQMTVHNQCRKIAYGSTLTYGELAAKCGSPKAARAVGGAMKSNRFPIVVPCHRVLRSGGLGGFSASSGVTAKQKMLVMEGAIELPPQMLIPGIQ